MEMPEQSLMNELNKILRSKIKKNSPSQEIPDIVVDNVKIEQQTSPVDVVPIGFYQEQELVKLLLMYGDKEIDIVVSLPTNTRILCEVKYRSNSPLSAHDAILNQAASPGCTGAFVATRDPQDYSITHTGSGARIIRIPAPVLCYILGAM